MLRFAWKTFSRWQMRTEGSDKEKKEKQESFRYMEQFRETFSRPVDSIRFVGLFDCVNRLVETEHGSLRKPVLTLTKRTSIRSCLDEAFPLSIYCADVCRYSQTCGIYRRTKGEVPARSCLTGAAQKREAPPPR